MRGLTKVGIAMPLAGYGWIVAASGIYLWGTDKLSLFRFPFAQWIQAAPWWWLNWQMTLWVIGSAAVPTLLLLVCSFGIVRHWWKTRSGDRPVYGTTDWADRKQMASRDISATTKLP